MATDEGPARPGRGARESTDYEHAPFVNRFVDAVLRHPEFHVTGPQLGYRNRMTYALRNEGRDFGEHPLAVPEVNALAMWMHHWVQEKSTVAALEPLIYDEMTVKLTRRQQLMLTLSIVLPKNAALRRKWLEVEVPLLGEQLRAAFPALGSAAYWVPARHAAPKGTSAVGFRAPPGPFSEYPYTVFVGEKKMVEEIPTGEYGLLPYCISHGTFSEINHYMEDRIVPTIMDVCRRPLGACGSSPGLLDGDEVELLVTGRDTNSVSLGLGRTRGPWHAIHAVSHCHLVADDCAQNQRELYPELEGRYMARQCDKSLTHELIASLQSQRPMVAVLSSGRHGLRPSVIEALRAKPNVVRVVYDSCNPVSLRRDMARFMGGEYGFVLESFRSFDFFASTPCVHRRASVWCTSQMVLDVSIFVSLRHLARLLSSCLHLPCKRRYMASITSFVRRRRSLIIPIGPCGVGKSTFASALRAGSGPACSISVFDRDQVFAEHRGIVMPAPHDTQRHGTGGHASSPVRRGTEQQNRAQTSQELTEEHLLAVVDSVWDACGRCGAEGHARRLATLMHAISAANPDAARAIGKPSSKWFKQRPHLFVLKPVKGGQHLVTRAAQVTKWDETQQQSRKIQRIASSSTAAAAAAAAAARAKHCQVLGVEQDASADAIRKRYQALARTIHPDRGGNAAEFTVIQSSYEALSGVRTVTLREALQATHADLVRFLTPLARKEWTLGATAEHNDANCVVPDGTTLLLDSTNGARDGRDHARRVSAAARVFLVQLRPERAGEQLEQWLLGRVANRPAHPAFPSDDDSEKQLRKIRDVNKGICWADVEERKKVTVSDGGGLIECDPSNEAALSNLAYQVWARVFLAGAVRDQIGL